MTVKKMADGHGNTFGKLLLSEAFLGRQLPAEWASIKWFLSLISLFGERWAAGPGGPR